MSSENLSDGEFNTQLREQLFEIKDDLLYDLITYGDGSQKVHKFLRGFTIEKGVSYAILAFLASRALGLYRLPFTPDRAYCSVPWTNNYQDENDGLENLLSTLSPERIESITSEIRDLYAHTQTMLTKAGLKEVILTRRIEDQGAHRRGDVPNYATQIARQKKIAEHHGRPTVKFEMDTLNSFGDDSGYASRPVMLEFRLPATDILYFSHLIASRGIDYSGRWIDHKHAVEKGEWVVINWAPDGVVELPIEQIHLNDNYADRLKVDSEWLNSKKPNATIVLRAMDHIHSENRYYGYGFNPKLLQRLLGAFSGLIKGPIRGFYQGWF